MPFTVQQIIGNLPKPVTAEPGESIHLALDRMLKHDYSQLPVVRGTGEASEFYLITVDSILTKLHAFGEKLVDTKLQVKDALVKTHRCFPEDDLSEVLQALRDLPAIVVVNAERQLINIVTPYDTTVYFRQWSEDMMRARDVENSLKEYINQALKTSDGKIDMAARQAAIEEVTSANKNLRKKFERAVGKYLSEQATDAITLDPEWTGRAFWELVNSPTETRPDTPVSIEASEEAKGNAWSAIQELKMRFESALRMYLKERSATDANCQTTWLDTAFCFLADPKEKPTEFSDLSLAGYIQLFFLCCWDRCGHVFDKDKTSVAFLLNCVRETRNKLAHFHEDEITAQDRLQLRTCAEFLKEHEKAAQVEFEKTAPPPLITDDTSDSKENP